MAKIKFHNAILFGPIGQQIVIAEMELKAVSLNFQDSQDPTLTILLENGGHPHPITLRGKDANAVLNAMRQKFPGFELWILQKLKDALPEGDIES